MPSKVRKRERTRVHLAPEAVRDGCHDVLLTKL